MKCDYDVDLIIGLVEKVISPEDEIKLKNHIASCVRCAEELKKYQIFMQQLKLHQETIEASIKYDSGNFIKDLKRRLIRSPRKVVASIYPFIVKLQAAAIVILTIGLFTVIWQSKNQNTILLARLSAIEKQGAVIADEAIIEEDIYSIASTPNIDKLFGRLILAQIGADASPETTECYEQDIYEDMERLNDQELEKLHDELEKLGLKYKKQT